MENTTFTRITLTRDIDTVEGTKAINSGSYPAFIVNLAKSIQGVTVGDLAEAIERTETAAASAKESEINAKYSETSAKDSETNASESELAAKTSESNAKASETAAKSSENSAKDSETKAKASETNAKTSETAAKTSESNAKTSEANSKASETSASDSAASAKVSETNSKLSEEEAKVAETGASSSASEAKTSETNAKASETNAKKSEDAAKLSETNAKDSEMLVSDAYSDIIDKHSDVVTKAAEVETARSEAVSSASTATSAATAASASAASASADAASAATSALNASASEIKAKEIADGLIPLFDRKLDKTGGTITKNSDALNLKNTSVNQALFLGFQKSDGTRRGYIGASSDKDRISVVNDVAATALTLSEDKRLLWQGRDVSTLVNPQGGDAADQYATPTWVASKENSVAGWVKVATVGTGSADSKNSRYLFTFNCTTPSFTSRGSYPSFGVLSLTIGNAVNVARNFEATYICLDHFGVTNTDARVKIKQLSEYQAGVWVCIGAYSRLHCSCITLDAMVPHSGVFLPVLDNVESGITSSYDAAYTHLFATANKNGNVQSKESLRISSSGDFPNINLVRGDGSIASVEGNPASSTNFMNLVHRVSGKPTVVVGVPNKTGSLTQVGDHGLGGDAVQVPDGQSLFTFFGNNPTGFYRTGSNVSNKPSEYSWADFIWVKHSNGHGRLICLTNDNRTFEIRQNAGSFDVWKETMRVGDFGIGATVTQQMMKITDYSSAVNQTMGFIYNDSGATSAPSAWGGGIRFGRDPKASSSILYSPDWNTRLFLSAGLSNGKMSDWVEFYSTGNTTKDSNGNLKAASPIAKLFKDKIITNEESEGVTMTRLSVGVYRIENVLGLNSDPSWGGIHGGIVVPKGINDLNLFWLGYTVEADGSIVIKTTYRKHSDMPHRIVKERLRTYPEFVDGNGNELESDAPCDIPEGHWVDIRVQMPEDSIFNIRKREYEKAIENNIINREREEALKSIVDEQNFWMNNEVQEIE